MDQRWVHPFLCGREILNCNWIMRVVLFWKISGHKEHGRVISSGKAPLFLHKIENMVYNTPGQYENIQNDTEVKRSERTTESGADRKKVKRMDMLNGGLAGKLILFSNSAGIQQYFTAVI